MSDIFISYSRHDRETAKRLAETLEERGWSVWWDRQIRSGQVFDRRIEEAIERSQCVVVLWSNYSRESDWVRAEASLAKDRGKLIPTLIEDNLEPPLQFRQIHAVSLQQWCTNSDSTELGILLNDIEHMLTPLGGNPVRPITSDPQEDLPAAHSQSTQMEEAEESAPQISSKSTDNWYRPGILTASAVLASSLSFGYISTLLRLHGQEGNATLLGLLTLPIAALLAARLFTTLQRKTALALPLLMLTLVQFVAAWTATEIPALLWISYAVAGGVSPLLLLPAIVIIHEEAPSGYSGRRVALLVTGVIIGNSLLAPLHSELSWQTWCFATSAAGCLLSLFVWRTEWLRRPGQRIAPSSLKLNLWSQQNMLLYLSIALMSCVVTALNSQLPHLYMSLGLDLSTYNNAQLPGILMQLAAAVTAGFLLDRGERRKVALACAVLTGATFWAPLASFPVLMLLGLTVVLIASAAWKVTVYQYACESSAAEQRPWVVALVLIAAILGGFLGPIAGAIAVQQLQTLGLAAVVGTALLAVPIIRRMPLGGR